MAEPLQNCSDFLSITKNDTEDCRYYRRCFLGFGRIWEFFRLQPSAGVGAWTDRDGFLDGLKNMDVSVHVWWTDLNGSVHKQWTDKRS